jgi:hypothetical protein
MDDIQFSKRKKGFHRGIKTHEHTNEPQEKCMSGHTCVAVLISWNDWISFPIYIFLDNWCFCIRAISSILEKSIIMDILDLFGS